MNTVYEGVVEIPVGYFLKMAKADYEHHARALWREFYQNSIDAKAGTIRVDLYPDTKKATIEDDGIGMTYDILKNKLLVLGGTHKEAGSVGTFGKAKELLFFSWLKYRIATREWVVEGTGANFTISRTDDYVNGTNIEITFPDDEFYQMDLKAIHVAEKMQTKSKIFVDGHRVRCNRRRGTLVRSEGWIDIYQIKTVKNAYAVVRVDGIWMFDTYVTADYGSLVFELKRSSMDCLTSNRDGLKWQWRREMENLIADLMVDKKSALREKPTMNYETIKGTGAVSLEAVEVDFVKEAENLGEVLEGIVAIFEESGDAFDEGLIEARCKSILEDNNWDDFISMVSELRFISYAPDFILKYEKREGLVNCYMSRRKAEIMALLWTETLKQVLMDSKLYIDFVAGFTFDPAVEAEYSKHGDMHYFYLNPTNLLKHYMNPKSVLSKRRLLMRDLVARAVHEVAHMKYSGHDENFNLARDAIEMKTWKSNKEYHRISKLNV